jgi:uncharacterized cupin superfamily protein
MAALRTFIPCPKPQSLQRATVSCPRAEGWFVLPLAGECLAIVEGKERRLHQWDYLHCPPDTLHVMIGAGSEPCAILMVGAPRAASLDEMDYPENELAARSPGVRVARDALVTRGVSGPADRRRARAVSLALG